MADKGMGQSADPEDLHLARAAREAGNEVEVIEVVEEFEEEEGVVTTLVDPKAFLEDDGVFVEKVTIPGSIEHIFMAKKSAKDRDDWEQEVGKTKGKNKHANVRNFRASLVAMCACREDGTPFFPDWRKAVKKIGARWAEKIDPIYEVAAKLNGVRAQDEDEATTDF